MISRGSQHIREQVLSNGSYKLVALVASVILWLTVLGRKEVKVSQELPVVVKVAAGLEAKLENSEKINLVVKGRRKVLKEFEDGQKQIDISLKDRPPGAYNVPLTFANLNIPVGLNVLSIKPRSLQIIVKRKGE